MSGEEYGCNVMELRNLMDLRSKQALDKVFTLILILGFIPFYVFPQIGKDCEGVDLNRTSEG